MAANYAFGFTDRATSARDPSRRSTTIQGSGPPPRSPATSRRRASSSATSRATGRPPGLLPPGCRPATATPRRPTASSSSPASAEHRQRRRRRPRHRLRPRAVQPDDAQRLEQQHRGRDRAASSTAGRARVGADRRDAAVRDRRLRRSATRACSCASRSRSSSPSTSTTTGSARSCSPCRSPARPGRSRRRRSTSRARRRTPARSRTACSRITLDDGLGHAEPGSPAPSERRAVLAGQPLPRRRHGRRTPSACSGFDFSLYRIQPTGAGRRTRRSTRDRRRPGRSAAAVRVAAMNTLNFFLTLDTPTGDPARQHVRRGQQPRVPRCRRRPAARVHAPARQAAGGARRARTPTSSASTRSRTRPASTRSATRRRASSPGLNAILGAGHVRLHRHRRRSAPTRSASA